MTHPIHTLPPGHLRGYAHGLRNTAALLSLAWVRTGQASGELAAVITLTREAWEREADLVEGFAARLESIEATEAPADDDDNPIVFWLAQDPVRGPWHTSEDLLETIPALEPVEIASNGWPATRWAIREFISEDGDTQISWADTREEMMAYAADLTSPAPTAEETAQSGLADAVAESLATGRPAATWTEERDALLALLYPTIICQDALFGLLNAMPGAPIASVQAVRQRAAGRDIVRQGLPLPEGYEDQPVTDRSPRGMPGALKAAAPPAERAMRSDSPWTKERLALMAQLIPTSMHMDDVHKHVSALPGLPIASAETLRVKACKIGIYRQGLPIPAEYLGAAMSRSRTPQMAEKPAPTTPIVKAAPAMIPEDQAEAREGLRTGRFRGAKDIVEEYGCTQAEAQALVDAHRAKLGKAA